MRFNKKIILILLSLAVIITLIIAIWMPYKATVSSMDFSIYDSNKNYHYEVNEKLNFSINDSLDFRNRDMIWHMGNGDTIMRSHDVNYRYNKKGKYLITLEVETKYKISKYIEVISLPREKAIDSIPVIHGIDVGYVGEELVFSSYSPGVKSWYWEFGETGTVDAYKGQVIYVYKNPGIYNVKLKTNTSKYPVSHLIQILPLFEAIEESEHLDSLSIAQKDIKKRLQTIADASINNKRDYYKSLKHIENRYTCNQADKVIIVINGARYNDLYSYCQGLHYLEGKGKKTVIINEVVLDTFNCVKKIQVTQSIINQ
ncbi:PKD domain-containing protein [Tenacibaculum finnmarkense]|uniref:PKD domain-containing protein n=3 Tax=Tenacibaculum finnmarkense TaxID=2781243 RepID=A0AAP1RHH1_9FLAO|nr:PKD domain-containing protein [Tenacibaculum finnmarkense genomovar finnmarkense]MCG8732089.1 PKD domain-containing protein [Tenacibaculum finnmarkense]MBE7696139.1 PKD domain-containing protein [Tenacibaculum finnmarkense genomovar finnmarkense]MCG8752857.1 PKD domain-containing protein [Tenacibaculum finnmarkense]MCG8771141.1 PKD domain-containing protein [Tenacibaculum finnmarkense]